MGEAPHTAGGALGNGKLKLATATANDVVSGKTFFAGDKVLKTGTGKIKVTSKKVFCDVPGGAEETKSYTVNFAELGLTEKPTVVLGFEYSYGHDRTISIKSYTLTNTSITIYVKFQGDSGWGSSNLIVSIITFG